MHNPLDFREQSNSFKPLPSRQSSLKPPALLAASNSHKVKASDVSAGGLLQVHVTAPIQRKANGISAIPHATTMPESSLQSAHNKLSLGINNNVRIESLEGSSRNHEIRARAIQFKKEIPALKE